MRCEALASGAARQAKPPAPPSLVAKACKQGGTGGFACRAAVRRMAWAVALAALAFAGCGRKEEATKADAGSSTPAPANAAGEVHFPADSPLLKRIRIAAVESARLPMEEVIA